MILNRLGLNNLIEPLTKDLEFQLQDPFLLYKNASSIYGVWFYDKDECARIGQLMSSLVQVARSSEREDSNLVGRLRRASESDTMYERRNNPAKNSVDILQMLSKAQDEYDKSKGRISPKRGPAAAAAAGSAEPKPMIDNPNASATATADSASLVRPMAIKPEHEHIPEGSSGGASEGSISLQTLFGKANIVKDIEQSSVSHSKTVAESGDALLKRLISNPGNTLEEIERKQRERTDGRTMSVGALESQSHSNKIIERKRSVPKEQKPPYSPDTDLKMKLNIISSPSQSSVHGANSKSGSSTLHSVHSSGNLQKHQPTVLHPCASEGNMLGMVSSQGGTTLSNVFSQSVAETLSQKTTGLPPLPTSVSQTATSTSLLTPAELSTPKSLQTLAGTTCISGQPPPASPIKPIPPPANVLMSPMAFQQSSGAAASQAPVSLHHSGSAQALQQLSITKPVTSSISPPAPSSLVSVALPQVSLDGSGDHTEINPLTREQLQQSLVYLIKNDQDFMEKIHEAYVKSLKRHH